ncbi:ABC transporter substrate-binding protein [Conexibacter woesei]|uniref:Extracellular solute-binding protein family 5 n=1 Tax=Conexibacter woesei (strain DSM 14684 / CCUG 47730 / CIP 108061 / JCM 11494 / NBRC 100937 / ID131577) TaxID=469383 RepID=D3F1T1_CONWI|nr:ABC transporter substrate-binding protein [Conexibacter woesei]ADB54112.1 extracellular solute-binding protein family 5 [Conexibacter woesei DSM 14684]
MTRRTTTLSLATAAVAAATLFSACGGATDSGSGDGARAGPPAGAEPTVTTPAASGTTDRVTWALTAEPASLDWVLNADFFAGQVLANVCDGLVRQAPDFSLQPALAARFSNPTPTTWVYEIRDGATFHGGAPLTANDVVFSLKRNIDPKVGSFWGQAFANVKTIAKTGPSEVTVTLRRPDSMFNAYMSTPAGIIGSERTVKAEGKSYGTPEGSVDCVGPYKLAKWEKGQEIALAADDAYWDTALKPKAGEFVFQIIRDPAARTNALLSGTVDGSWFVPPSALARLNGSATGRVFYGPSTQGFNAIVLNTDGPLRDVRIRQALSMAIDREGIVRSVLAGAAQPSRAPAVPGTWGYAKETFRSAWDGLEVTQRDVDAARRLVQEAGAPKQPITISVTSRDAEVPVIGAAIQAAGEQIGLKVVQRQIPPDQYDAVYTSEDARKGIDLYLTAWGTDFADPLQIYEYFKSGNFYNFAGFSDPRLDALLNDASRTTDEQRKAELVTGAQRIVVDELLWIPLYAPYNTLFMNKRITGAPASYVQLHYPWAAAIGSAG